MARLLVLLFCISMATTQRNGNIVKDRGDGHDQQEIQRQNKITAQILENFLERRLFPNKRPTHKLPTVDEILPKTTVRPARSTPKPMDDRPADTDEQYDDDDKDIDVDPESLQSVESEHVDSYYEEDEYGTNGFNKNRGRFCHYFGG